MKTRNNQISLIGRLGSEPKTSETATTQVANFSVAVNEYFTSNSGEKKRTTWFNVVAWGELAKKVGEMKKGAQIKITGRMQSILRQKGNVEYTTYEVVALEIELETAE